MTEHAQAALAEIVAAWPRLSAALEPGSRRRWVESQRLDESGRPIARPAGLTRCPDCGLRRPVGPEQVVDAGGPGEHRLPGRLFCPAGCDDQPDAPGYTGAPLTEGVLSCLVSVGTDLAWLEDDVREALGFTSLDEADGLHEAQRHRQQVPRLAGRDPVQCAAWLDTALPTLTSRDPSRAAHVERELTGLARAIRRALGDVEEVRQIKAPCPICLCMSLRAFPEREVIVCVNDRCRCQVEDCLCRTGRPRRHRWVRPEWDWLARVLGVELAAAEHGDTEASA